MRPLYILPVTPRPPLTCNAPDVLEILAAPELASNVPVDVKLLFIVVVPELAPISIRVAASNADTVVTVLPSRLNVAALLVKYPPFTEMLPASVILCVLTLPRVTVAVDVPIVAILSTIKLPICRLP